RVISSIMGLYRPEFVSELKARKILWFATATTVDEARSAATAGADGIIAQGSEAGGHRGAFYPREAERNPGGVIALLARVVDAVDIPVIAAGGIGDGRGIAAALILGASAVQIGTGFLRSSESTIHPVHMEQISKAEGHETALTRAYTGRTGRCIANDYT